jgi:hypothetical protein
MIHRIQNYNYRGISKKKFISFGIVMIVVIVLVFLIRSVLSLTCMKYGTPGRGSLCKNGAPFYCATVHRPPSCIGCQDSTGCGFR